MRSAAFCVILVFVGCHGQREHDPTPAPATTAPQTTIIEPVIPQAAIVGSLFFTPSDLATSVGVTQPRVVLRGLTKGAEASYAALARDVELLTWPELTAVPSTVTQRSDATDIAVEVSPSTPLADRWYVLRLARLPTGIALAPGVYPRALGGDALGARFRPGSDPVITQAQYCVKPDEKHSLGVDFSEKVKSAAGSDVASVVDRISSKAVKCSVDHDISYPVGTLWVLCDSMPASARLQFANLLSAATSAPVTRQYEFDVAALPETSPGCRMFRP